MSFSILGVMSMYTDKKSKAAAIIGYLFVWLGVIVALILRDKDDALSRHHLNQAIVLATAECIASLMIKLGGIFAAVGEVADVALLVLAIMGIIRAAKGSAEPLPIIGDFKLF